MLINSICWILVLRHPSPEAKACVLCRRWLLGEPAGVEGGRGLLPAQRGSVGEDSTHQLLIGSQKVKAQCLLPQAGVCVDIAPVLCSLQSS